MRNGDYLNIRQCIADHLDQQTRQGRVVGWIIQSLIILSLIDLAMQTIPDLDPVVKKVLDCIQIICMFVFVIEYSLRVYTAKHVHKYLFSFYGIIDLLAIIPYFIVGHGIDSVSLRSLRILRVLQLLKLTRYSQAVQRFKRAFHIAQGEIIFFIIVTMVVFYCAAVGIYHFEHVAQPEAFKSIPHSLWWAVITLTTIGYGDVYPVTEAGKIFTMVTIFCGLGIVSIPAAIMASALSEARKEENYDNHKEK